MITTFFYHFTLLKEARVCLVHSFLKSCEFLPLVYKIGGVSSGDLGDSKAMGFCYRHTGKHTALIWTLHLTSLLREPNKAISVKNGIWKFGLAIFRSSPISIRNHWHMKMTALSKGTPRASSNGFTTGKEFPGQMSFLEVNIRVSWETTKEVVWSGDPCFRERRT